MEFAHTILIASYFLAAAIEGLHVLSHFQRIQDAKKEVKITLYLARVAALLGISIGYGIMLFVEY